MSPEDSSLPWAVILTALVLAIAFAILGFGADWSVWKAFLVLGLGSLALIALILVILLLCLNSAGRRVLWRSLMDTIAHDWKILIQYFWRGH